MVRDGAALLVLVGGGADAVECADELGPAVKVDRSAEIDGERVVREQRVHFAGLETQGAAIHEGGAADELTRVQIQNASEALGHARGTHEPAGDGEGLPGGDVNDALGRARGAEGDDRHAERSNGAGAAAIHEQRTGRERERGRGQAGEAADSGRIADQRAGRDRQRIERLVAGERVGGGGAGPEGLRSPRAEDIAHRGVTGESADAVGGGIGGELVAKYGHLGKQPGRGGRQGRRGGEQETVRGGAEGPDDVERAARVDGQRSEGQRRRAGAGQADGVPAGVRRKRASPLGGGIRDEFEGATLQRDTASVDAVVQVRGRVVETQDGAARDRDKRAGAAEGDRAGRGGQDDGTAVDLEAAAIIDRAGDRRVDGQRPFAVFIHPPERPGLRAAGAGEHDVSFGVELQAMRARRSDQSGEGKRAAGARADGGVPRMRDGAGIGVGTGDALELAAEIDATLEDVVHALQVERIADGHAARQTQGSTGHGDDGRDRDGPGAQRVSQRRIIDEDRALVDVHLPGPTGVAGVDDEGAEVVLRQGRGRTGAGIQIEGGVEL